MRIGLVTFSHCQMERIPFIMSSRQENNQMSKSSEKAQQFLSLVALVILPQGCEALAVGDSEVEIHRQALTVTSATFGAWVDYQDVYGPTEFHGDTFQTAWSDDENLYMSGQTPTTGS